MALLCNDSALWDTDETWYNTWPQFADCFQSTVLVWVPCGWLWLTSPFYIYYILTVTKSLLSSWWKYVLRTFVCGCLVLVSVVRITQAVSDTDAGYFAAKFIAPVVQSVTFIFALILMYMERRKGLVTSGIFFVFWILLTITGIVPFYTKIIQKEYETDLFNFSLFIIYYTMVLASLFLSCVAEALVEEQDKALPCLEVSSSFLSRITFWWVNSLMLTGYRKALKESDIRDIHPRETIEKNMPSFLSHWHIRSTKPSEKQNTVYQSAAYKHRSENQLSFKDCDERTPLLGSLNSVEEVKDPPVTRRKRISLTRALLKTFWPDLLQAQVWKLFYVLLNITNPLLLGELIRFTEDKSTPVWKGYTLGVILFCSLVVQSLNDHATWHQSTSVCLRARAVIVSAIFRKALTMTNQSRRESTVGEIVNLMSVDTENIRLMIQNLWGAWASALQIILSLVLLYNTVGLPMLAGLGLLVLVVPFNYVMVAKWQWYQRELMRLKDDRMKIVNEVLNGIKILKLYAWEPSFRKKIMEVRSKELHDLWWLAFVQAFVIFTWNMTPYLVALATLLTYIYTTPNHYLSPQTAFVAMALLNILRFAVVALPDLLAFTIQSHVSMKRISKYLESGDLDETTVQKNATQDLALSIKDATFAWETDSEPIIKSINLTVERGQLVAVVGQVGAGKSSLISAICGEMEKREGQISVKGNLAYVPQQAWIQNDTLQNNILFGKPMNKKIYKEVLECCALTPDLEILPAGDLTEIGERGINLSGGQKQRVSLARAVYNDADIYILDDPLSAVDSHVGRHIFEKLICDQGLLGSKTRLLVTHGIQWLPHVDTIVVLTNGQVSETGTYEELLQHNGPFAQFLQNYLLETGNEDDGDPEESKMKREVLKRLQSVKSEEESDGGTRLSPVIQQNDTVLPKKEAMFRQESVKDKDAAKEKDKLVEEEEVEEGKVSWKVYGIYARAFSIAFAVLGIIIYVFYQSGSIASNIWLSEWTDNPDLNNLTSLPANSSERLEKNDFYLGVYGALGVSQAICILAFSFVWGFRAVSASRILHDSMLDNILRAPMSFFDTTPTGRIVNRFSQDINSIDVQMPHVTKFCFYALFETMSSVIVMSYSTPIFLVVIVPLFVLYYFIQVFFVNTTRQLQRLVSKTRSPIFSHFGETIAGASVIRAFHNESRFIQESEQRVDKNQQFLYYAIAAQRWLGVRLETMGAVVTLAATLFAVGSRDTLSGGLVGLSITYGLQITINLNWLVRMMSEVENRIVSVERVNQYTSLEEEAKLIDPAHRPSLDWPQKGVVKFMNYSTRYREGLDLVLKGITCTVTSGEKVGIVGRTGAGKSSLTLSLFRLIEAAGGEINIDGIDIGTIGLHDLRKKLTILPQDPVLFAGSLRENVDPFNEYSDRDIWRALDHAHLNHFVESLPETLEYDCSEGGENMSVGQRQLLCLARALLKKTKILILDEATAAVDMETDELIQETIRSEFKDCTVLTIAHRLNTVMDYDRILVLNNGCIAEFDTPSSLLQQPEGIFYNMAKTAGLAT